MARNFTNRVRSILQIGQVKIIQPHPLGLILLLCLSLYSETVKANPQPTPSQLNPSGQGRSPAKNLDNYSVLATKAEQEAEQLYKDHAPLLTKVIAKWEEVLKYWHLAGNRDKEAATLVTIAGKYYERGENLKVVEYSQKALSMCKALSDRFCETSGFDINALDLLGYSYMNLGETEKGESILNSQLHFPKFADREGGLLLSIGIQLSDKQNKQKALDYFNRALAFWKGKGDIAKQVDVIESIALLYGSIGEVNQSINFIKQASTLNPEFDPNKKLSTLFELACKEQVASLKQPTKTKQSNLKQPTRINQSKYFYYPFPTEDLFPSPTDDIQSINRKIEKLKQGLQKNHALENLVLDSAYLKHLLAIYTYTNDQQAMEVEQQLLKLEQIMGNKENEAYMLNQIADLLKNQGKIQEAIDLLNQALKIQHQIKSLKEAYTLSYMGELYEYLGEASQAVNAYQKALSMYRNIGYRIGEFNALTSIASIYRGEKDLQALKYYKYAIDLSHTIGNCQDEVAGLMLTSSYYLFRSDYQEAINQSNHAIDLSRNLYIKSVYEAYEANLIGIRAAAERQQGNYSQALKDSEIAIKLAQESASYASKITEMFVIINIAKVYTALKQPEKALPLYQEVLAFYRQKNKRFDEAETLKGIADLQRQTHHLPEALTQIQQAIAILEDIRTKVISQNLRTSFISRIQDYYQLEIDILMELHKQDPSKGYDALALNAKESSHARGLVELLTESHAHIRQGIAPELLAEETRLQAVIDAKEKQRFEIVNSEKNQDVFFKAKADNLQTEIQQLLSQTKELETKIRSISPKYANLKYPQPLTLPQIQQQLDPDTLLLEYSLGKEHSYLWLVSPHSLYTYQLPKQADIEKNATNLFCLVRNGRSKPPSTNHQQDPCTDIQIKNIQQVATKLSQQILAPVKDKLEHKRLVIVADGALQYIPFAILADLNSFPPNHHQTNKQQTASQQNHNVINNYCIPSGAINVCGVAPKTIDYQPLLVNHEIVNIPSASTIAIQRQELNARPRAAKALAILADPVYSAMDTRIASQENQQRKQPESLELEKEQYAIKRSKNTFSTQVWQRISGTRTEAEKILNLVPASNRLQALDFNANYNLATSPSLNQYRILHFATHGFVNDENPELSGIVLSLVDKRGQDIRGYLRLEDLFNLNYPADLVVLSACETGLGKEINGEGLVGLTRGLMYAGAERLVVSLWEVDDELTAEFMEEFYRQMLQEKKSAHQALRGTQLKMWQQSMQQGMRANNWNWAAFTFLGEWR